MADADEATSRRPPKRRAPWSLRSIVVEVTGKPITEFQNPREGRSGASSGAVEVVDELEADPVGRLYPPLAGPRAREFHGPRSEHHAVTIDRHRPVGDGSSLPEHPEKLYLHYLLLHLDRLSLPSLWYLRRQVNDEISSRAKPRPSPPPPRSE